MASDCGRQSDSHRFWKLHLMLTPRRKISAPNILSSVAAAGSFDADTNTWASQVVTNGGTVSNTSKGFVDTLIKAIKASSNLGPNLNSKLLRLWLFANNDTTGSSTTTDAQA